jgi:hypothetical protein
MTDDEVLYAANETLTQLECYRAQLEARHRGKIVHAYGGKYMRIDTVRLYTGENGGFYFRGTILKKDGTPNKAVNAYSVDLESAKFS